MKKSLLLYLGLGVLVFSFCLNLRFTLNDYGILENKLAKQVLAQTNYSPMASATGHQKDRDPTGTKCILNRWYCYETNAYMDVEYTRSPGTGWTYVGTAEGNKIVCLKSGKGCDPGNCKSKEQ